MRFGDGELDATAIERRSSRSVNTWKSSLCAGLVECEVAELIQAEKIDLAVPLQHLRELTLVGALTSSLTRLAVVV